MIELTKVSMRCRCEDYECGTSEHNIKAQLLRPEGNHLLRVAEKTLSMFEGGFTVHSVW